MDVPKASHMPVARSCARALPCLPVAAGSVSAPITWDELDDPHLTAGRWDMRTIIERVAERGDLFAGVLTHPQELPPIS